MRASQLFLALALISLLFSTSTASITAQYGHPLFTAFVPDDYKGEGQTFSIAVNDQNIVYVANSGGVLEYDGQEWRLIEGTLNRIPLAIDIDDQNRVWVALQSDIGVLVPDSTGKLKYASLSPMIEDTLDTSQGIWRVRVAPDGIYYQSPRWLLRWTPSAENPLEGSYTYWESPDATFSMCCVVDSVVYVRRTRLPVEKIVADTFQVVEAWRTKSQFASIVHAVKIDDEQILFSSFRGMLLLGDKDGMRNMPGEVNEVVKNRTIFGVVPLSEGRLVVSTNQGMVVFDHSGKVLESIDKLGDLSVTNILREGAVDQGGGVWFPLNFGMVRVEFNRPHRVFDSQSGLEGSIIQISRFREKLYVATTTGLYYLPEMQSPGIQPTFREIKGVDNSIRQFIALGDKMFIASMDGFYVMKDGKTAHKIPPFNGNATNLVISRDQRYIYVGTELNDMRLYEITGDQIIDKGVIHAGHSSYDRLIIDNSNNFWVIIRNGGFDQIYRSDIDPDNPKNLHFTLYGADKGIRSETIGAPIMWKGMFCQLTRDGIMVYDEKEDRFHPYMESFPVDLCDTYVMNSPPVDNQDRIYISAGAYHTVRVSLNLDKEPEVEELMERSRIRRVFAIYPDTVTGLIAIGGDDGRLFFIESQKEIPTPNALLREIRIADQPPYFLNASNSGHNYMTLKGPLGSIRFIYTLTSYDAPEANEFQYRLVGRNQEWSDWSGETYRDFNDLREGAYRFEVRGRDYSGTVSEAAVFNLQVLSPWYRTAWMQLIWALLVAGIVYLVVRIRTSQLAARQQRLEKLVEQRTEELQKAQAAEIREIEARKAAEFETQRLKTVAQLATTIAHELNNPLAVIQGRIEVARINSSVDSDLMHVHQSIQVQVERMSSLVEKLCGIESIRVVDYAGGIKMLDLKSLPGREEDSDIGNEGTEDTGTFSSSPE